MKDRADEVDDFWAARITAFRPRSGESENDILTVRGMYVGLYRVASRAAHAQLDSLDDCIDLGRYPLRPAVVHLESSANMLFGSLSTPLFVMALLVSHARFGWPDPVAAQRINDALLWDVDSGLTMDEHE